MSHIYVYAPSSAVVDKTAFKRGIKRLQNLGHEVEIDPAALTRDTRFAGDDATRVAAIHRAAASGADVAITARGGYGLSRILGDINYKAVAKSIHPSRGKGTHFVGFSDFTAFQCALLAKTGAISWSGPSVGADFGAVVEADGSPDCIMEACFDDLLVGHGEGAGWRMPIERRMERPVEPSNVVKNATNNIAKQAINTPAKVEFGTETAFTINNGLLWGGNLSLIASLVGTPYMPAAAMAANKRGILFLEDVAEHPYRIERYLTQLLHAGILAKQKAIVLGQFTHFKLDPADKGYKLQSVVDWLRSVVKCPVLTGLPMGHVPTKVLLPVGETVTLAVEGRDALLVWG